MATRRKLSNSDYAKIVQFRKDGMKYKEIAQKFKCSYSTITRIVGLVGERKTDVKSPDKIPKNILKEWDEVTERLRSGFCNKEQRENDEKDRNAISKTARKKEKQKETSGKHHA